MPAPLGVVAWVALIPFAAALTRARATFELYVGAYLGGMLFGLHSLDFIRTRASGSGLIGSPLADWIVNACVFAAVWPVTMYLGRRFVQHTRLTMIVALPVIWICSEYLRQEMGWLVSWSPFPWLQIGVTQAPHVHFIQVADLGGTWAVAATVVVVNGALFDALATRRLKPLGIAVAVMTASWLYGEFRLRQTVVEPGPTVALVPELGMSNFVQGSNADILLWAETSYVGGLDDSVPETVESLEEAASASGATLMVGCVRKRGDAQFNSVAIVEPGRGYLGAYDKCFLVPWSEFTPWSWSERTNEEFVAGSSQPVFATGRFHVAASICYDACFDRLFRRFDPRPDFFVSCSRELTDPTGRVSRAILDMTRLRAAENRRSFVRNVQGGYSGVVNSNGEFTAAPRRPWAAPVSIGPVPIDHRVTLATVAGDWIPWTCCLVLLIGVIRPRRSKGWPGAAPSGSVQ